MPLCQSPKKKLKSLNKTIKPNFVLKALRAQTDSLACTNHKAQEHSGRAETLMSRGPCHMPPVPNCIGVLQTQLLWQGKRGITDTDLTFERYFVRSNLLIIENEV